MITGNKDRLTLLRKEAKEINFFTGSYLDLLEKGNSEDLYCVSISGGILVKELDKSYGEDRADDIFIKVDFQEKRLAPSLNIYSQYKVEAGSDQIREKKYFTRFQEEVFSKINLIDFLLEIIQKAEMMGKKSIIFLCYENPKQFCHRHIVASGVAYFLGKEIPEISTGQTKRIMGRLI